MAAVALTTAMLAACDGTRHIGPGPLPPAVKDGMLLADNGSAWYISGAPDSRWSDDELDTLKRVPGSAFEVVRMDGMVTR